MLYTAIMGHGVVGSGTAELMVNHADRLNEKIDGQIELKYILDIRDFDGLDYSDKFIKDFNIILNDDSVKIVVEVMGGLHPAYDYVKACLLAGKNVVSSNKELVAEKGAELLQIAKEKNVNFLFEASVGGGTPVLRPIAQCLCANSISEITGILNGTTNYILNKMIVDNMDFDSALALAKEKGFAEKNPDADISGTDAARKIAILASLAFGKHVYPRDVKTCGIENVTLSDIDYADNFNCVIKLISKAKREENGKVSVSVCPTLVDKNTILSHVDGVFNAIMIKGDAIGDVMFYGKGAGKMPTASAVVADVLDCAKHLNARKHFYWEDSSNGYVVPYGESTRFYVRLTGSDFNKLLNEFNSEFSDNTWNLKDEEKGEIVFITDKTTRSELEEKLSRLAYDDIKILNTLLN